MGYHMLMLPSFSALTRARSCARPELFLDSGALPGLQLYQSLKRSAAGSEGSLQCRCLNSTLCCKREIVGSLSSERYQRDWRQSRSGQTPLSAVTLLG